MSNTKKIAIMSTLVLLLAVTAVFNFILAGTNTSATGTDGAAKVNYFTSYRSERTTTRNEEFIQLDSIIAAYASDSQEYTEAVASKQKLVEVMETELIIESMIKTIGFSDVAVAIGATTDNINIFVNSAELNEQNVTQIFSIVEEELSVRNGNIVIMPIYAES